MPVDTTHALYDQYAPAWKKMRDVLAGHDAIQKAKEEYLPRLSDQLEEDYKKYLTRATFFGATGRVVDALSGMLFRKEPVIEKAESIPGLLADMTLTGVPFPQFAEDLVEEQLGVTRVGVLVDHPSVERQDGLTITLKTAETLGYRVYAAMYKAEDIINWRTTKRGGKRLLSMVVLRETESAPDPKDAFTLVCTTIFRELKLDEAGFYCQVVWRPTGVRGAYEAGEATYPLMNGVKLQEIPFEFFGSRGNEPDPEQPTLYDLAVVNLAHYRKTADYEHGLHFTGLPTAVISGVASTDATYSIGSGQAWVFSDANAKAFFLEFTGQGLGALEKAILSDEARMAALGARMLSPEKKDAETVDALNSKRQGENSTLASMGNATSRGLTRVLAWMAEWSGIKAEVTVKLHTDFNINAMSPQAVLALLQAVTTAQISSETFYEALVKGEVISGARTYEEEQAKIGEAANDNPQPVPARDTTKAAVSEPKRAAG